MKLSLSTLARVSTLALTVSVFAACGKNAEDQLRNLPLGDRIFSKSSSSSGLPEDLSKNIRGQSVELISRNAQGGSYNKALYSFYYESRNDVQNDNWADVQFDGSQQDEDSFNTVMVTDQFGMIKDIGETSCNDIKNDYQHTGPYNGPGQGGYPNVKDRIYDPMFWLEYTQAWDDMQRFRGVAPSAQVHVGHCYLLIRTDNRSKEVAMFHVKSHVKTQSVVIDELEIFQKLSFKK